MSADDIQRAVLDTVAARGGIVRAGNREYYAFIRRAGSSWIRTDGDSMTGAEGQQPTDEAVLTAVCWRARDRLGHDGPDDGAVTWNDVYAWLRDG
jgi:hypothetical protein